VFDYFREEENLDLAGLLKSESDELENFAHEPVFGDAYCSRGIPRYETTNYVAFPDAGTCAQSIHSNPVQLSDYSD
jgi:hypothetical protein